MTCATCQHWKLQGPLAQHGYGQCMQRPEQQRAAFTTSGQNVCRLGKFSAMGNPISAVPLAQEAGLL